MLCCAVLLLAHQPSAHGDWSRLDLAALVFPPELRRKYETMRFINDERISTALTVPGVSGMIAHRTTQIWAQRAGMLGWTCGNLVASAHDVPPPYLPAVAPSRGI